MSLRRPATTVSLPPGWRTALPFAAVGSSSIVFGGLVAAVTGPLEWADGSWVAAFLVLVTGVALLVAGLGQAFLVAEAPAATILVVELATWVIGSALTILGTLVASPPTTTVGTVAVLAALVLFLREVWNADPAPSRWRLAYVAVLAFVVLSTPVGLALAWLRHG